MLDAPSALSYIHHIPLR